MSRKKILIVDDTETFLYILNHILKENYETIISKSGEDGLETAKLTKPDLILLDVMMPGMSGYDVLRELKADDQLKEIPVILITGNSTEENEAEGYALGAADYIKKPFVKSLVIERVTAVIE
ncbi:MAG: response regulator [Defluviitaleaceae bacterium]|nr:response regulator [Defluviitaleaceae bacterium]